MARSVITVTDAYVLISSVKATITIKSSGSGSSSKSKSKLLINDVASDVGAEGFISGEQGKQILQTEDKDTYVRATVADSGWTLILDEEG